MTHAELVIRAARWLRNTEKCAVVLAESGNIHVPEIPDAIGWSFGGVSTLVECKSSRADFFSDAKKERGPGCGNRRFFMVRNGLVSPDETPDGWGLLGVDRSRVLVLKEAPAKPRGWRPESAEQTEIALLVAEFSRTMKRPAPWAKCGNCKQPFRRVGASAGMFLVASDEPESEAGQ